MSYNLIEKQVIFDGTKVRLELHHLETDDGRRTRREVCVHPGAVVILPLLDDGRVVPLVDVVDQLRSLVADVSEMLEAGWALHRGERSSARRGWRPSAVACGQWTSE